MFKIQNNGTILITIEKWNMEICCLTDICLEFLKTIEKNYQEFENFLYQENKNAIAYIIRNKEMEEKFNSIKVHFKKH